MAQEDSAQLNAKVDGIIAQYHQELEAAITPEEKERAIVRMVATLEKYHIFSDGNIRTLVMLVLNRELVKNGFSPTVMDNPNFFDMSATNEIIAAVEVGMDVFEDLARLSQQQYFKDTYQAQKGTDDSEPNNQSDSAPEHKM